MLINWQAPVLITIRALLQLLEAQETCACDGLRWSAFCQCTIWLRAAAWGQLAANTGSSDLYCFYRHDGAWLTTTIDAAREGHAEQSRCICPAADSSSRIVGMQLLWELRYFKHAALKGAITWLSRVVVSSWLVPVSLGAMPELLDRTRCFAPCTAAADMTRMSTPCHREQGLLWSRDSSEALCLGLCSAATASLGC